MARKTNKLSKKKSAEKQITTNKVDEEVEKGIRQMVKDIITSVKPFVDAARISQMFFEHMPSEYTSQRARRNTLKAREHVSNAICLIRGNINDYVGKLTQEQFDSIVDDALRVQLFDVNEVINRETCL